MLATVALPANDVFAFDPVTLPFAGTARSIVTAGGPDEFGIDDLRLGTAAVPAPAGLVLAVAGIGAIVGRRKLVK